MKRAVALVLAGMLLAGCSTVGNVFKKTGQVLMDPSIPVGMPDDQPTRIALSLYAGADVNPNPVSVPAVESNDAIGPLDTLDEGGPFAVSFSGSTQEEVVSGLRALMSGHMDIPGLKDFSRSRTVGVNITQAVIVPALFIG